CIDRSDESRTVFCRIPKRYRSRDRPACREADDSNTLRRHAKLDGVIAHVTHGRQAIGDSKGNHWSNQFIELLLGCNFSHHLVDPASRGLDKAIVKKDRCYATSREPSGFVSTFAVD